jgi:hypothetical protein
VTHLSARFQNEVSVATRRAIRARRIGLVIARVCTELQQTQSRFRICSLQSVANPRSGIVRSTPYRPRGPVVPNRFTTMGVLLVLGLSAAGCRDLRKSAAQTDDSRFELKHDQDGRLVRLDKSTGEVTVVESPAPAGERSAKRPKAKRPNASSSEPVAPAQTACGSERPKTVTVSAPGAPVFIQPRILPTPLVTLAAGTELPVVRSESSWYYVRFDDKRWGPRFGYIQCSSVVAGEKPPTSGDDSRPDAEPVLLSPR